MKKNGGAGDGRLTLAHNKDHSLDTRGANFGALMHLAATLVGQVGPKSTELTGHIIPKVYSESVDLQNNVSHMICVISKTLFPLL